MQDITGKSDLDFGYSGTVTLGVKYNDKLLTQKEVHNSGNLELFKYIVLCLAGEATLASKLRPLKIRLYSHKESSNMEVSTDAALVDVASNFIAPTAAPTLVYTSNYATITFHYLIPFFQILSKSVDQVCLYGVGESDTSKYSASFLIVNEEGTELDPIKINKEMSNLSLIIDWELKFKNIDN